MSRAPFQVLVIPFCKISRPGRPRKSSSDPSGKKHYRVAIFKRADLNCWQFVAGGGENEESPAEAATRELVEETGISATIDCLETLKSRAMIDIGHFPGHPWPPEIKQIPEHCFAVELRDRDLRHSCEHSGYRWVSFETAMNMLEFDSNRRALLELHRSWDLCQIK